MKIEIVCFFKIRSPLKWPLDPPLYGLYVVGKMMRYFLYVIHNFSFKTIKPTYTNSFPKTIFPEFMNQKFKILIDKW